MADLKQRLGALISDLHSHLIELSRHEGYGHLQPRPHPPATPEQIAACEKRLGLTLPPSYRAFLELHNGYDGLAYPGHMLSLEDTQPGGRWAQALERWKEITVRYGAVEVRAGMAIANLGQPNDWVYLDPCRPGKKEGEWMVVEWCPEDSEEYPSLVEFLEECLATVQYGIAEANGTLPDEDEDTSK